VSKEILQPDQSVASYDFEVSAMRERERQTERERERERREKERETETETETETERQRDRETEKERERKRERVACEGVYIKTYSYTYICTGNLSGDNGDPSASGPRRHLTVAAGGRNSSRLSLTEREPTKKRSFEGIGSMCVPSRRKRELGSSQ